MGVRTKAWGPHAWKFIHGLCKSVDDSNHEIDIMVNFLTNLNQVLPCIYCRKSMGKFVKATNTNPKLAKSFAKWAYLIHERVNKKLFWQDVSVNSKNVWKWLGYQPDFTQVLYILPDNPQWWFHLFTFTYYIICDYPENKRSPRVTHIRKFLFNVAKILTKMNYYNGMKLQYALENVKIPDDFDTSLHSRCVYIHNIQLYMRLEGSAIIPLDTRDIQYVCENAIVGCDPNDKNKVGC